MAFPFDLYDWIKEGRLEVRFRGANNSPAHHRFWAQLDKDGPIHPVHGQCWQWVGAIHKKNKYGFIQVKKGEILLAHRYSWILHNGGIPEDLWVLHKCDNPSCVNPAHLFLGTHEDNMEDMVNKDRHAYCKGDFNPHNRLTEEQVLEIRRRHRIGMGKGDKMNGSTALAKEFGVHRHTILDIVSRKAWTHI
jgi:hypothetical protein